MLVELRLENYAVIDNVAVEFAAGLNLLTGETGAGKSILIDALGLLLGEKASAEVVRAGAERAVIAAVFEPEAGAEKRIDEVFEQNGLDRDESAVILRREIAGGGKGRVFVNNQPATVAVLKQLAAHLANIHAQSESIAAFDGGARLALLDAFAGLQTEPIQQAHAAWRGVVRRMEELQQDEQDRLRLVDLWTFQKREIEEARLEAGEDERLETEKQVLANAEKIYTAAMNAFDLLYEGDAAAAATLRAAQRQVEELARYEPKMKESLAALESARIAVQDVAAGLRDYAGGIQASPEHLAEVEDRLAVLAGLKRKYGASLAAVIEFGQEAARRLAEIENKDETLRRLDEEREQAAAAYLKLARAASRKREEAARRLEKRVEAEINDLAMKAEFRIEIEGTDEEPDWTAEGFDQVAYMISTNPGEPRQPLEKIASGGEMSRVMLALKASAAAGGEGGGRKKGAGPRTLVFDEIDTGIGGRAAEAVGRKLKQLARSHQVLCVTHLPQIATFGDQHYLIEKKETGGRTRTTVRRISGEERTEEVARMLSGAKLTETSRKHAEQMIKANG